MQNKILMLLIIFGILLALFGIGIDYLLPGTSPGLNLPQLLIIAAGLALSTSAWQLRRAKDQLWFLRAAKKAMAPSLAVTLVTLVLLELVLSAFGMTTYYPPERLSAVIDSVPWWTCDELGCHYVYEPAIDACENGVMTGRQCILNRQGFSDDQDFVYDADFDNRTRLLVMGDSFTHGFTADIGKSYVETVEAALPEIVLWNTGIVGFGTHNAVANFKAFAPELQPQLAILGFFTNDIGENLLPLDGWIKVLDSENNLIHLRRYVHDRWGNPSTLDRSIIYAYSIRGLFPPMNEFERMLGTTRLGTLVLRVLDSVGRVIVSARQERDLKLITQGYLEDLRESAASQRTTLLVLVIPTRKDFTQPTKDYLLTLELMQELKIPFVDSVNWLDATSDYATPPDVHWNNAGHQKVGANLSDCIESFIASGSLSRCKNIVFSS